MAKAMQTAIPDTSLSAERRVAPAGEAARGAGDRWVWIVAVALGVGAGAGLLAWLRWRRTWEYNAGLGGDVGDEGTPDEPEVPPVGTGHPSEHCPLGADDDAGDPHCVVEPLGDPRFTPADRGAPPSSIPSSSTWPLASKHPGRLTVSYWTAGGVRGYSGRAFATRRSDSDGSKRKHAGVDLFARDQDVVLAPEAGTVLAILPFTGGTWAIYIRAGSRIVNLGEVEAHSWREFNVEPGQAVAQGQKLARIGEQDEGSTMLHLETYEVGDTPDVDVIETIRARALSWPAEAQAHAWLRDPSGYLVQTASRTYRRETIANA